MPENTQIAPSHHRFVLWFRRLLGKPTPPRYFIGVDHGNGYERSCRIKIKVNHDGTKEIVEHDFFEENTTVEARREVDALRRLVEACGSIDNDISTPAEWDEAYAEALAVLDSGEHPSAGNPASALKL